MKDLKNKRFTEKQEGKEHTEVVENIFGDNDKADEEWKKKAVIAFDEKQKIEIEEAKVKAAEQLEATKKQMEEQKAAYERENAAYEREIIDDQPPTLEEVSAEDLKIEELMKTKQRKEKEWFDERQKKAECEAKGEKYVSLADLEEEEEAAKAAEEAAKQEEMNAALESKEELEDVLMDEERVREGMKKVSQGHIIEEMTRA
jgi:hypothetical protein